MVLADALERSQGQGGVSLRDSLAASQYRGVSGDYSFDEFGDPIGKDCGHIAVA